MQKDARLKEDADETGECFARQVINGENTIREKENKGEALQLKFSNSLTEVRVSIVVAPFNTIKPAPLYAVYKSPRNQSFQLLLDETVKRYAAKGMWTRINSVFCGVATSR